MTRTAVALDCSPDETSEAEAIELQCLHTSREEAAEIANREDDLGREVVDMSTDVPRALDSCAKSLQQIELGIAVRRRYGTFREYTLLIFDPFLGNCTIRTRLQTV